MRSQTPNSIELKLLGNMRGANNVQNDDAPNGFEQQLRIVELISLTRLNLFDQDIRRTEVLGDKRIAILQQAEQRRSGHQNQQEQGQQSSVPRSHGEAIYSYWRGIASPNTDMVHHFAAGVVTVSHNSPVVALKGVNVVSAGFSIGGSDFTRPRMRIGPE